MLGGIIYGVNPNILREIPSGSLSISFAHLISLTGLKNVVSGHDPEIFLFPGVGDALVCNAGRRWHCMGLRDPDPDSITSEQAIFLAERLAFNFFDWGAKEVMRNARLTGMTGHETLPPSQWSITPDERDWLRWANTEVNGDKLIKMPGVYDPKHRVRAGPRPEFWPDHTIPAVTCRYGDSPDPR